MPKSIACVNLKGGVGKTALAVNFAAFCGRSGKKTLLVDLDPQTNATFSCIKLDAWEEHATKRGTVSDLLGARRHSKANDKQRTAADVILKNVFANVDLVPSHLDLFTVDLDLASATAREKKLKRALTDVLNNYDIIVCDCPPNLTIPTQNALAMCTHYVVPISPDYLSGIGVGILLNRVKELGEALENELEHVGIVMSRVGRPAYSRLMNETALRTTFGDIVLRQKLVERSKVSESAAANRPIYDMGDAEAAAEFEAVSRELLRRMKV